jgi:hypothetical protein
MKLSQLKQIIKEEINELGFDYPGKPGDTPSQYQNGIMDTLKAMQQLGVNIDVQAVMDIIYPDDESPVNEGGDRMTENYMFFSNLKQMHRQIKFLMEINPEIVEMILQNGHDWADDHVTVAKENMDQVFDFMMNKIK